MHPHQLTPPNQLSAFEQLVTPSATDLRFFVFTEPPFDAVISAVNGTDRLINEYSQYKHGGEIWWIRGLLSEKLSKWRTSKWSEADVIVPPLPLGFCANEDHKNHSACVATRKARDALQTHASLAAHPERFLLLGTDFRLRGSRPLGDAQGFFMGTKLPSDPDVGQARSLIVPFVSSAASDEDGPAWWAPLPAAKQSNWRAYNFAQQWHQWWSMRPIRSFFVGQASLTQPSLAILSRTPAPTPCTSGGLARRLHHSAEADEYDRTAKCKGPELDGRFRHDLHRSLASALQRDLRRVTAWLRCLLLGRKHVPAVSIAPEQVQIRLAHRW